MSDGPSLLRSPASLRPQTFKKGQSGYPGGRRPQSYQAWVQKFKALDDDIFEMAKEAINERPVTASGVSCAQFVTHMCHGKPPTLVKVEGDLEIRVSEDLRKARERMKRMIVEGVAEAVETE